MPKKDMLELARRRVEEKMQGMSFLAHLEELRMRIIKSLLAVAAGFSICWWWHEDIYRWMEQPIMEALRRNGLPGAKLIYTNPTQPFNMYMKMGFIAGLFLASPVVLYQIWAFVAPGLYRRLCRISHHLSPGPGFPGEFWPAVPAHDHDRRVHGPVSRNRHRHGPGL